MQTQELTPVRGLEKERHNLDSIIQDFKDAEIDLSRMSDGDIAAIKSICDAKDCVLWLVDHVRVKPVFINTYGKEFYGLPSAHPAEDGISYSDLLHPDHFSDIHKRITFFSDHPGELHRMPFYIKCANNEYRWTFSEARGISFDVAGRPTYVMSIVYDIEAHLMRKTSRNIPANYTEVLQRNNSLTQREREILNLIANELTSQQIGDRLGIQSSTVDSHRKHLIKKLKVRSSLGLVRYALLYTPH